jgi:hypothetical protein
VLAEIGFMKPANPANSYFKDVELSLGGNTVTRSFHPLPMADDTQMLGRCPDCGDRITPTWMLVEYERDDGTDGVWAECPSCEVVVAPE